MITIDPTVENELFSFLSKQFPGGHVRIMTTGIGCAGPTFRLSAEAPRPGDVAEEKGGFVFSAPKKLTELFGGYVFVRMHRGIRIRSAEKVIGGCESCINTVEGHPCH